ncbi:conserved Plasmodium protein, unknown function [Plasmodium malariae]|uniref:DNA-directed primase/polymerase protein n=1 Tax=Plasmodium malariae TaxID=5858 RepID=A0A1A8WAN7_PLAMA|nr:conserved Plasmodium protein, unknown function [Plasmodium malariae]
MAIDSETFYGKGKDRKVSSFEGNIEKYSVLKRISNFNDTNTNSIKKRYFYKQHDALLYYRELLKWGESNIHQDDKYDYSKYDKADNDDNRVTEGSNHNDNKKVVLYTEELENGKRCFILDSFYNFLKSYCIYALSLEEIYFGDKKDKDKNSLPINRSRKEDEMHLYELIITNENRWLFFDIEYDMINNYESKNHILFIFLIELCLFVYTYFDIKICLNDILILESSSNEKISFHIIVKNIHILNYNYYEYLVDYCYFFLKNNMNIPENNFYDKYKKYQTKMKQQQNYLLFSNENYVKYFVDLFINHIITTIEQSENACIINSSTVYIQCEPKGPILNKNYYTFNDSNFYSYTNMRYPKYQAYDTNARCFDKVSDCTNLTNLRTAQNIYNGRIERSSNNLMNKNTFDLINDFSEVQDLVTAIEEGRYPQISNGIINNCIGCSTKSEKTDEERGEKVEKNKKKGFYFDLYNHMLEYIVEHYIKKLKNENYHDEQTENYIILLFAIKKDVNLGSNVHRGGSKDDKRGNNWGDDGDDKKDDLNNRLKDDQDLKYCELSSKLEEYNYSKQMGKDSVKRLIQKQKNNFVCACGQSMETNREVVMLKCIIDNSVYSRNRNFRMIFSSKKKNNNKLLVSNSNVKKYDKRDISNLILKSLVAFYFKSDLPYKISEDALFKNDKLKNKYGEINFINHGAVNIYNSSSNNNSSSTSILLKMKQRNVQRNVSLDLVNYDHAHNMLKIIFYWNFELYKNFKKNKIYVNNFQSEINKEYFYRIILIYNNLKYENYEHINQCNISSTLNFENEEKCFEQGVIKNACEESQGNVLSKEDNQKRNKHERKGRAQDNAYKGILSINYNYLDKYDILFLKNETFFFYVLSEYKKIFNIKADGYPSLDILFVAPSRDRGRIYRVPHINATYVTDVTNSNNFVKEVEQNRCHYIIKEKESRKYGNLMISRIVFKLKDQVIRG